MILPDGSSDVGSDAGVIQHPIPTAVSVRTVVAEEWMDRFVVDLLECPSVSRTSAVARTFGPAVSEEYSPVDPAGRNAIVEWSKYDLVIFLDSPLCRHPVWPDGGSVFAELYMYLDDSCLCVFLQLLAFNPAVHRTASASAILFLTFSNIFLLHARISQGTRSGDRQNACYRYDRLFL